MKRWLAGADGFAAAARATGTTTAAAEVHDILISQPASSTATGNDWFGADIGTRARGE